ncbi:hypothetical protein GCM10009007_19330 [Formosimonas limnophila]|uniref:Uncharacterized protein n=1 Tax=Formosimonas limnophila TaxID=1384487 RepID=A0A8J3G0E2_9BURK|nr:hypothetical protein [Formosimonas limnophila]GHA78435.1 hypothetical protein GCM10009007_19330 [Formosimonas limnophila]
MTNNQKINLGAPSLTGKDNNTLVKGAFAAETYPLTLILTSRVPVPLVFGDAGVALGSNSSDSKTGTFVFRDSDQLNRFATDIEMISEINGWVNAITVEKPEATPTPSDIDEAEIETATQMERTQDDAQEPQGASAASSEAVETPPEPKPSKTTKAASTKKAPVGNESEQAGAVA